LAEAAQRVEAKGEGLSRAVVGAHQQLLAHQGFGRLAAVNPLQPHHEQLLAR
jgi:hypothetical protein